MSEPQKLQHRLAAAFQDVNVPGRDDYIDRQYLKIDYPVVDNLPPLEPDPDSIAMPDGAAHNNTLRYWLAGASLVAAALAISVGTSSSFVLLSIFLGMAAVAALLFAVAERLDATGVKAEIEVVQPKAERVGAIEQEGLAAAGLLMGSIHDALGDITLSRSLKGTILSSNATFRQMTGCEEPEGHSCEELGIEFVSGDKRHCYDVTFKTPKGQKTFLWHDIVTRDPVLGDLVIQSIARDVTADRQEVRENREARRKAEEESLIKSELMATVSHEIRTPLSGLLGMGYLLSNTKLSSTQQNYLSGMREAGNALIQLVEDLLDYSTVAAGHFKQNPRSETIRPLIEGVVEMLSSRAHEKGIEIGAVFAPGVPERLVLDAARLRQVIYNVIGNAVKFTDKGGITVSTRVENRQLVVSVMDTGPGMGEIEMAKIFEAFEQGDVGKAREGGVGLGLAISNRIIAEMGGSISVDSKPAEGTSFVIWLPVGIEGGSLRSGRELSGDRVVILAPVGPVAKALSTTLEGLGAEVHAASSVDDAEMILAVVERSTGIIVDHRLDEDFRKYLAANSGLSGAKKVLLVSPESRPEHMSGETYDGWLVRPLREQSLIDVLTGKLRGLERRTAEGAEFPTISAHALDQSAEAREEPTVTSGGSGLAILVGEDDPVNAMLLQAIVEKAGHSVMVVETIAELDRISADGRFDIVITDFSMADGNCLQFIENLRAEETQQAKMPVPVVVLTADVRDETRRNLLIKGADLVLIKPASHEMLLGAIERLANRQTAALV